MNYIIVIPTYKRHTIISGEKGTLYFLKQNNIPKEKIILFVADEEEKELYDTFVNKDLYSGTIVVGKKGILNQRHFIMDYFPEGQYIISIDDDIQDMLVKNDKKLRRVEPKELNYMIENSYILMKETNANLWGINMITNPLWMQDKISTNLTVIVAGFYGFINHHNRKNIIDNDAREDVERSILFFDKDNVIIKYLNITIKTRMRETEGGIQALMTSEERTKKEDLYTQELKLKYPQYFGRDKKTGIRISLARKRSNIQINYFNILDKYIK